MIEVFLSIFIVKLLHDCDNILSSTYSKHYKDKIYGTIKITQIIQIEWLNQYHPGIRRQTQLFPLVSDNIC